MNVQIVYDNVIALVTNTLGVPLNILVKVNPKLLHKLKSTTNNNQVLLT